MPETQAGTQDQVLASRPDARSGLGPFAVLAAIFVALALWGVWGIYNYYMPAVAATRNFSLGIVTVSLLAGCAAFFSPCAFGMLPSYFGFYTVAGQNGPRGRTMETALKMGLWAGLGIAVPGILLAALIAKLGPPFALGLRIITPEPNQAVQVIRILLGAALIVLGIYQLRGRTLAATALAGLVNRIPIARNAANPSAAFFLYGVAFLVASTPCTANVMVAPILFSFATGGVAGVAGTVLLMVLAMGVLMIITSVLFGIARDSIVLKARVLTPDIQRAAGILLVAMGLVIIYFTLDTRMFFVTFWTFTPPGVVR